MDRPRVSCLMVSHPARYALVPDAVRGYLAQTWEPRELVVAWAGPEDDATLRANLGLSGRDDVRIVHVDPATNLGQRRNVTFDAATGDLLCGWDDDDLYHPDRLRRQVEHLQAERADVSMLGEVLVQDVAGGRTFWVDYARVHERTSRMVHNSLVMRRGLPVRYPESGPFARQGEDSDLALQLFRVARVAVLGGAPWLYVYRYHGTNTVSALHLSRVTAHLAVEPRDGDRAGFEGLRAVFGGPTFESLGRPEDALAWYQRALDEAPADAPETRRHRAWEAVRNGDLSHAEAIFDDLARRSALDLPSLLGLASILQARGRLAGARALLGPALERYPVHPSAVAALASLALAEDRPDEAVRCFDGALALAPHNPVIANDRAVALARAGRLDDAIAAFQALLRVDPSREGARDNLARLEALRREAPIRRG